VAIGSVAADNDINAGAPIVQVRDTAVATTLTNSRLSAAVTPTEPSRPGNRFSIRSH
jgi:hypothetical protein